MLSSFDNFVTKPRASTIPTETHYKDNRQNRLDFPWRKQMDQQPIYQSPQIEGILNENWNKLNTKHLTSQRKKRKALITLKNNKDLIINSADKVSKIVVVQNRSDYITQNLEHLNDTITYLQLVGDPTEHMCKQIKSVLMKFKSEGYLSNPMHEFCLPPLKPCLARPTHLTLKICKPWKYISQKTGSEVCILNKFP